VTGEFEVKTEMGKSFITPVGDRHGRRHAHQAGPWTGEKEYAGKGVSLLARSATAAFFSGARPIAVVGGGRTRARGRGAVSHQVRHQGSTVIHRRDEFRASAILPESGSSPIPRSKSSGTRWSKKIEGGRAGALRTCASRTPVTGGRLDDPSHRACSSSLGSGPIPVSSRST